MTTKTTKKADGNGDDATASTTTNDAPSSNSNGDLSGDPFASGEDEGTDYFFWGLVLFGMGAMLFVFREQIGARIRGGGMVATRQRGRYERVQGLGNHSEA